MKSGVFYQFWVKATNEWGEGDASAIENYRTTRGPVGKIMSVHGTSKHFAPYVRKVDLKAIFSGPLPPIPLSLNRTVSVTKGRPVSLPCAHLDPEERVVLKRRWLRDGRVLTGDFMDISASAKSGNLNFRSVQPEDAGNYSCEVAGGVSVIQYRLVVQGDNSTYQTI